MNILCINIRELPFDFEIINFNLLIEIDGAQHFRQVRNWKSHKITQQRDVYKMKQAIKHNYSVIRISQEDIWHDRYNWQSEIIKYIKRYNIPQPIYLSKNKDLYNRHKQLISFSYTLNISIKNEFIINIISKYLFN